MKIRTCKGLIQHEEIVMGKDYQDVNTLNRREFLNDDGLAAVSLDVGYIKYMGRDDKEFLEIEGGIEITDGGRSVYFGLDARTDEALSEGMAKFHSLRKELDDFIDAVNTTYLKIGGLK